MGEEKLVGRKRHIVVDTLGLIWTQVITPASVQDCNGGKPALAAFPCAMYCVSIRPHWSRGGAVVLGSQRRRERHAAGRAVRIMLAVANGEGGKGPADKAVNRL